VNARQHGVLLGGVRERLHARIVAQTLEQREEPFAVGRVRKQRRQGCDRALGFVAHDDFLFTTNAAREIPGNVRQQLLVIPDELVLELHARKR